MQKNVGWWHSTCLVSTQTAALPCQILPLTEAPPNDLWSFVNSMGIIEWSQSNRADILTHGVSRVDWRFYKHPLPEHVYDLHIKYWPKDPARQLNCR
jgi:hypothetical protein